MVSHNPFRIIFSQCQNSLETKPDWKSTSSRGLMDELETGLTFLVIGTWLSVSVARTGWVRRVWHSRSYLFVCSRMNCLFVANDVWKIIPNVLTNSLFQIYSDNHSYAALPPKRGSPLRFGNGLLLEDSDNKHLFPDGHILKPAITNRNYTKNQKDS